MNGVGIEKIERIRRRVRAADYLAVAQLYLQDNFLLKRPLEFRDIKPRLLGHWGTCHGINVAYANLKEFFDGEESANLTGAISFVLGPGHGFPALQANLFLDGELSKVDKEATQDLAGMAYLCRNFSWPDGFPSHANPLTPGVITEGGELGYALANAYGFVLGHPEKVVAVLIGDGELETATTIDSLNLENLLGGAGNGRVLPILHLNGYKISAPSIYARKSERELNELIRGFGFSPVTVSDDPEDFQEALAENFCEFSSTGGAHFSTGPATSSSPKILLRKHFGGPPPDVSPVENQQQPPKKAPLFLILKTEKGEGGPNRHHEAHQIPLKNPKTDENELKELEKWLKSYRFNELFDEEKGVLL